MTDARRILSWLLLTLVAAVTAGGAFLAVWYAPSQPATSLSLAAKSTKVASSYTENLKQVSTTNGVGQLHLVFQAPSRAAGFQQATGQRLYFVVVGDTVYQTTPTKISKSITVHHFRVVHAANALSQVDPLSSYLALVSQAKGLHQNGSVFSFSVPTSSGGKAQLRYTISGEFVSKIQVNIPGATTQIDVTRINTSPPVKVPAKSSVTG